MGDVESAFKMLESCYFERYEEEILTPDRANIRIRIRFSSGHMLEWNEAVVTEKGRINHLGYRYHFQDNENKLIFRFDNTPHFPHLETFAHHKHLIDTVIAANRPSITEVLKEAKESLS